MSDEPIKRCPECGKKVRRLIGGGLGVIFKGSGFYVTDNRGTSKAGTERPASKESNGNGSKSSDAPKNGSDSKPATSSNDSGKSVKEKV